MTFSKMLQLALGSVGTRLVGAAISLVTQLVLTRSFAPADVGVIFLAMSMAAIFSLIASAGYPSLSLTQLPRFQALGLPRLIAAFHGAFLRDLTLISLLLFVAVGILLALSPINDGLRTALIFGALSAVPSAIMRYNGSLANTLRRYLLAFLPDFLFRPGLFFVYIAGAYLLGLHISPVHVLWVFIAVNSLVAVTQFMIMRHEGLKFAQWFQINKKLSAALKRRVFALAIVGGVTTLFSDIVTLIGGFLLPQDQVAVLGLTIRLAGLAGFIIQSSQQFILNDLTQALTVHDTKTANAILSRMNLLTIVTLATALLAVIFLGRYFLNLFGPVYAEGHWLLVLFVAGQSVRALSGMNQHLLSISGHQLRSALASMVGIVILYGSWVLLQNWVGLLGVGLAVITAEIAWALMLGAQAQELTGRRGDFFWLLQSRSQD